MDWAKVQPTIPLRPPRREPNLPRRIQRQLVLTPPIRTPTPPSPYINAHIPPPMLQMPPLGYYHPLPPPPPFIMTPPSYSPILPPGSPLTHSTTVSNTTTHTSPTTPQSPPPIFHDLPSSPDPNNLPIQHFTTSLLLLQLQQRQQEFLPGPIPHPDYYLLPTTSSAHARFNYPTQRQFIPPQQQATLPQFIPPQPQAGYEPNGRLGAFLRAGYEFDWDSADYWDSAGLEFDWDSADGENYWGPFSPRSQTSRPSDHHYPYYD